MKLILKAAALVLLATAACKKKEELQKAVVVTSNGNINEQLNNFRNLLGAKLNTTPNASGGRREINWDAVPDDLMGLPLPNDFFNPKGNDASLAARQRGLTYTGTGAFMVSKQNFAEINAEASTEFAAFSGNKLFANTDASLWDIAFEVAGASTQASVKGFGAVFADVDVAKSTFMEFYNGTKSLGKYYVPVQNGVTKFSFLGVYFNSETITSVKVGHNGTLKNGQKDVSQGGTLDLIALDDFLYSEPVAK
jgi:hypothetical protein